MQFLKSLKTCAIGSIGAGVFLSLMSLVPRPFSREEQIAVWSGAQVLSLHDFQSLLGQFSIMYTLLSLIPLWWYVRELSIWMIYLGTSVIGVFFLNQSRAASSMAFLGILTIPCLYLFDLSKIWFIWLIAWHCVSAAVIWKMAAQGAKEQIN